MTRIAIRKTGWKAIATCTLIYCLVTSGLSAVDRESGNQKNSNWSIQYGFGYGTPSVQNPGWFGNPNASVIPTLLFSGSSGSSIDATTLFLLSQKPEPPAVNSYGSRFYAEYAPNIVGFVFGINSDVLQFTFPQNEAAQLIALQQLVSSGGSQISTLSYLLSTPAQKAGVNATTLDFGLNLHMNARNTFDPYFMLGLGVGACNFDCYAGKVFTRLGLRVNLGPAYLFLEGEYNSYWIKYTDVSDALQANGPKGTAGFGIYL